MTKEVMVPSEGFSSTRKWTVKKLKQSSGASIIKKMIRTISYMMSLWRAVTSD